MDYISLVTDKLRSNFAMSPKKLQKLSYYVYAWYLTIYNQRLHGMNYEAWVHGPVEPQIYSKYKKYGWDNIPKLNKDVVIEESLLNVINKVVDIYGDMSADALELLTHKEEPWISARKNLSCYQPSNKLIDDDDIKNFYKNDENYKYFLEN